MTPPTRDRELEQYRDLVHAPDEFAEGFTVRTALGILFIAAVMMPSSIYMGLIAGQSLGAAAEWVTIILFAEIARRSFKPLTKQELYILYYVGGSLVAMVGGGALAGGPFASLIGISTWCSHRPPRVWASPTRSPPG